VLQRLENAPLFVREDVALESITPKFTELEMNKILTIRSEEYNIPLGAGGSGTRYWVELPNGDTPQICRVEEPYYGDAVELLNEYVKANPNTTTAIWVNANARELNIARHYYSALNSRKIADLHALKANISLLNARSFAEGKWGLTPPERTAIVLEYGFDPDRSYDY